MSKAEVEHLRDQVNTMGMRLSGLVDEIRTLQKEVNQFKASVAKDMTTLESLSRRDL